MKRIVIKLLFGLLKITKGKPLTSLYSGRIQVLMFHRVVSSFGENRINNDGIEVTEDYLDFLIAFYIKKGFIPISINDLKTIQNKRDKNRYVVFTFDDGYYDNYSKALPIFEKHQVPFTVYIATDFINRKQFGWWYYIEDVIRDNSQITYFDSLEKKTIDVSSYEQKESFFVQLRELIQSKPETLSKLIESYPTDIEKYYNLFLNEEQLTQFAKHPLVTIGSHSITHPSLSQISAKSSYEEIYNSKIILEKLIDKKVEHFSYPFGTINDIGDREVTIAEKAGYLTALTTSYGDVYYKSNLHKLPRIWTSNKNTEIELLKIVYGVNSFNQRKNIP